ncbi:MAG: hypothetical protein ACREJ3_17850, partial [Polyangiaceae bacterium]
MSFRSFRRALSAASILPFALGALVACGAGNDNLPPPPAPPPPPPAASSAAPTASSTPPPAASEAPPAPPPVELTQGIASPDPVPPTPTVKIVAPARGQVIAAAKATDFAIKLHVANWKTAPGDAHVHLILDDK